MSADSPPRHRRRSSFFERRSSVPEPSMHNDLDESKGGEDDEFLYQELKMAKNSDKIRIHYSLLSDEDIEFIRGKQNLPELVDSVKKLQKSTMETYGLYKTVTDQDDVILRDAEEKVKRVTKFLVEL